MKKVVGVVLVAFCGAMAFAENWGDRTGDVVIADGTTVEIGDADVATLASVTSITIGEGAVVLYTASTPLTLTAPVSGTGEFVAKNAGALTLAADNSGLRSPGHFSFTNTKAVVAHEYGLGGKSTDAAFFHIDNANGKTAANIAARTNYSPVFDTTHGPITNHVDIAFDTLMNFGSESNSVALVMDASLLWKRDEALNSLYAKGYVEFINDAKWSSNWKAWKHGYTTVADGYTKPIVRLSDSSSIQTYFFFGGGVTWLFDSSSAHRITCLTSTGTYVGCGENLLPNVDTYFYSGTVLDLGGFNQKSSGFNFGQYGSACTTEGSTSYATVRSDTPAKIVLSSSHAHANYLTWGVKFTGAAGIQYNSSDAVTMVNQVSDSTGEFAISKGSVEFKWNAGWANGLMTITGGTVIATSPRTMSSGRIRLVVGDTGRLLVADGVRLFVSSAKIGPTTLETNRTYTLAELDDMGLSQWISAADGASGSGTLETVSAGWPGEEGGPMTLISGEKLVVGESDLDKLRRCTEIRLMVGSELVFSNTTSTIDLSMPIIGYADSFIRYCDGAYAVIGGDNSEFLGSTVLDATSTVIVSNRYGLGTSATQAVVVPSGGVLQFGGAGLTNDVPLTMRGNRQLQVDTAYGPFVQNSKLLVYAGPALTFGDAIFNARFENSAASPTILVNSGRTVVFNAEVYTTGYFMLGGTGSIVLNSPVNNHWDRLYNSASGAHIVCGAENVLLSGSSAVLFQVDFWAHNDVQGYLDLNGYNQTISHFEPVSHSLPANYSDTFYPIISAAPATLTLSQSTTSTYAVSPKFIGQAGLHYAGNGTLRIAYALSTSTAPLTVSSGTVELFGGAGWSGDVNVSGTGRLVVDSSFGIANTNAVVTVSDEGVLEVTEGTTLVVKKIVANGHEFTSQGFHSISELRSAGATGLSGDGRVLIGADVYVDAVNGDDANDGFSWATAKKTLAAAATLASLPSMTIHAAPGVYSNGCMATVGTYTYNKVAYDETNRVVVAEGVTLVSEQGPAVTFIEGADSTSPIIGGRCGPDSMRCVYMQKNTTLRGFTLRNGSTVSLAGSSSAYGGGVRATDSTCNVIDCVISNCYSWQGSAAANGRYLRCYVVHNRCGSFAAGIDGASLIANCVFKGNGAYSIHQFTRALNCTFLPGVQNATVRNGGAGLHQIYNSVIGGYIGTHVAYTNCIFTDVSKLEGAGSTFGDCEISTPAQYAFDADNRPVFGSNGGIDNEKARAYYEEFVVPAFGKEAAYDFARGQRIYNGALDLGAGEYDCRPAFAKRISNKVCVANASEDVTDAEEGSLRIVDGQTVELGWKDAARTPSECRFRFAVRGGTLVVKLNGVEAGSFVSDGEWRYPGSGAAASSDDRIEFSFTASSPDGQAELLKISVGVMIIVR